MSIQSLDKIQKWVVIICSIITVILIGLFTTGKSYGGLEVQVQENTIHRQDKSIHIPRSEWNMLKQQLDRIENKIDAR